MKCPHCGRETEGDFCPTCGYRFEKDDGNDLGSLKSLLRKFKNIFSIFTLLLFLAYLILNTSILIWSLEWVPQYMTDTGTVIYVVLLVPVGITEVTGTTFIIYFFILVFFVLFSYIFIFYKGVQDFIHYIKETLASKGEKSSNKADSPIPRLAYIFMTLLFFSLSYYMFLERIGISPETSGLEQFPLWQIIYLMTRAAVWEELLVRTVFLGLPMFFYIIVKKNKWDWKYIYGGFGLKDRFVIIPILLSSTVFAVAHLGGWDVYKLPPTFIAGLAFGYLYAKDGLHSAILLHFIWDFLSVPTKVFDIANIETYLGFLILLWMAAGIYYLYHYGKRTIIWLSGKNKKEKSTATVTRDKKEEESIVVPGLGSVYVCPQCGNNKAIYTEDGKLECKRCGNKSETKIDTSSRKVKKRDDKTSWPPID
ncbi:MAG: CPBP family glutamic-type intramembrane protease [Candidatus Saliniplasma sp.]